MHRIDQGSADCFVLTHKEGLLSAVAHDLKIRVTRFQIDVDPDARSGEARFDASSLRVVCAMQDGVEAEGSLGADQKSEIEGNIVRDVLASEKHPEVHFVARSVVDEGDGFRVTGELSLHGKRRGIEVQVRREASRYVATATVHQPDFGIRPYSALFGALKVKPDVEIRLLVPWPPGQAATRSAD